MIWAEVANVGETRRWPGSGWIIGGETEDAWRVRGGAAIEEQTDERKGGDCVLKCRWV